MIPTKTIRETDVGPFDVTASIKEIGRGRDGARSLDAARARTLFDEVFAGRVEDMALGGLLIALRMKGETVEEVHGALDALEHGHIVPVPVDPSRPVVAIPSYNGARNMANLTPLLAALLADAGVQVVMHGVTDDPRRTTTWAILHAMGIGAARSLDDAANLIARNDPAFVPIRLLSPALDRLLACRARLGVRNIGHTLAKVLNPSDAPGCLRMAAYTHPEFDLLQHALFARMGVPALVMRGTEGEVVANVKRRAKIDWLHEGRWATLVEGDTLPLGDVPSLPPAQDAIATARWIQSVLSGERPVPPVIATQVDCVLHALRGQPSAIATGQPVPA